MPIQGIQLFRIPQTCALIALGIRKSFCSFANHCSPISKCRHHRRHTEARCVSPAWKLRFLTVGLSHSIRVVLPKLRALPFTPGTMDDCAAGVSRTSCHLPSETQRLESGTAHGRALYLDRTPLKTSEGFVDHPKGGWSHLTLKNRVGSTHIKRRY
jgi:hypothetical protein